MSSEKKQEIRKTIRFTNKNAMNAIELLSSIDGRLFTEVIQYALLDFFEKRSLEKNHTYIQTRFDSKVSYMLLNGYTVEEILKHLEIDTKEEKKREGKVYTNTFQTEEKENNTINEIYDKLIF